MERNTLKKADRWLLKYIGRVNHLAIYVRDLHNPDEEILELRDLLIEAGSIIDEILDD